MKNVLKKGLSLQKFFIGSYTLNIETAKGNVTKIITKN